MSEHPGVSTQLESSVKPIRIGRNPKSDIFLDYPMISWDHARLLLGGDQPILEDLGSTNGTFIDALENRIQRAPIDVSMTVFFGSFHIPASRLLQGSMVQGQESRSIVSFHGEAIVLGRAPDCERVLDFPMVSWKHARISRTSEGMWVEDLGSSNGTFLNGKRIQKRTLVRLGDSIGLGSYAFTLDAQGRFEQRTYHGNLTIEARGVCIDVPGKRLIEDISLTILPSEMVAIMGTSGAGKTTFLNTLCGYVRPSQGSVTYNGQDLGENYDQFRHLIGYAPQDDIMHRELTVYEALYYTAKLRLPSDFSQEELDGRVRKAIAQVNLGGTEKVLIGSPEKKGISGGQRKRVNIAMELLTDPEVLLLDEPTSGLSSKDSLELLEVLRGLADQGKTIILIIHQPSLEIFKKLDNLIQLAKDKGSSTPGQLVYYGPAYPDAIRFFSLLGAEDPDPRPEAIEIGLEKQATVSWARKFADSPYRNQFVQSRQGKASQAPEGGAGKPEALRRKGWEQWLTLVRRMFVIKRRDTWNSIILLGQAPLIALLLVLGFGESTPAAGEPSNAPTVLFLEAVAALWFGCSNSAREIVGEWAIYRRERMATLKLVPYACSKFAVLGVLCVLQCLTLTGIVHAGCSIQAPWLSMFGLLLLAAMVGLALGLTISALAKTTETAVAIVPLVLLPMVILGGTMKPVHRLPATIRPVASLMPSRWAFEAMVVEASRHTPPRTLPDGSSQDLAEPFFPTGKRAEPKDAALYLACMLAVLSTTTTIVLRRKDLL